MKGDSVQPTRISKEEYARFKQFVQDTHGMTRGHLKTEIENALREYRKPDNSRDALSRIEDDVATIKATLATAEADGGSVVDTSQDEIHTHAPTDSVPSEKPKPNSATEKKVRWLAAEVEAEVGEDFNQVLPEVLRETVKDAYGFRRDTAQRYVEELREHFDLVEHPGDYPTLVTQEYADEWDAEQREQREAEAREEVDDTLGVGDE